MLTPSHSHTNTHTTRARARTHTHTHTHLSFSFSIPSQWRFHCDDRWNSSKNWHHSSKETCGGDPY
jgi:hypothetical protein